MDPGGTHQAEARLQILHASNSSDRMAKTALDGIARGFEKDEKDLAW